MSELSNLLMFINQCPFGLVKTDEKGKILLLNGVGSQLLIPVSLEAQLTLDNLLTLIHHYEPAFYQEIIDFSHDYGYICSNRRLKIAHSATSTEQYLSFTIIKLSAHEIQFAFKDVTDIIEKERRINEITEASAVQQGKLEMASGILHDIGNAVTSFGTDIAKLTGNQEWREGKELLKLKNLFANKSQEMDEILGKGKAHALLSFIDALVGSLKSKEQEIRSISTRLYETTSHIQDILNIQRHYVKGKTRGERAPVKLHQIIADALAIHERNLEKREINIFKDIPLDSPSFKGDRTKLIQVLINLFKNAAEAFDEVEDDRQKQIHIQLSVNNEAHVIRLIIKDNAIGFPSGEGELFFEKGKTSKDLGTGFGLHNCRKIIETHHGKICMESEGIGKGASILVELPYKPEEIHILEKAQ